MVTIANADIGNGEAIRLSQNRSDEYCTHYVSAEGRTVWGHYFSELDDAYADYHRRVAMVSERLGDVIGVQHRD